MLRECSESLRSDGISVLSGQRKRQREGQGQREKKVEVQMNNVGIVTKG